MKAVLEMKIGDVVAEDFRTAAVFSKNKMDFCCGGHKTVQEVCEDQQLDSEKVAEELQKVMATQSDAQIDYRSWPLDLLADYIEKTHHRYVRENAPQLIQYLNKLCRVHGENHPELFEITRLFIESAEALEQHMEKEEQILFPFVRKMVETTYQGNQLGAPPFGTVENPVRMMMHEHDAEGERFRKIAELSGQYEPPADACGTYRVTYAMLEEFEQDLHKHIHLENNILFPGAVKLEKKYGA